MIKREHTELSSRSKIANISDLASLAIICIGMYYTTEYNFVSNC